MESSTLTEDPYAASVNKDRDMSNVKLEHEPLVFGPKAPQHEEDYDMTFDLVKNVKQINEPFTVKDFQKETMSSRVNKTYIEQEYSLLERLLDHAKVTSQLLTDKIYLDRNRYSDILTYKKNRVLLQKGVKESEFPEADYINACFINSPFQI